jgi:hypothetical protein
LLILTNWVKVDVGLATASSRLVFGADLDELVELRADCVGASEGLVGNLGGALGGSLAAHGALAILGAEDVSTSNATTAGESWSKGDSRVGLLEESGIVFEEVGSGTGNDESKGQSLDFNIK